MSTHKKQNKKECSRHTFSLKSKSHANFYQQPIIVNFCHKSKAKSKNDKNKAASCYEGPIFNKDYNYLTSSFIVNSEKKKYIQSGPAVQNHNKYYNFHQEKSEMVIDDVMQLVPKPNSKNMYCNVCKEKYEDYLEHIESHKHKKKIQNNSFNDYIIELEAKYKTNRSAMKLKQKQNTQAEAYHVIVIDESSQIQQLSRPTKKVKIDKSQLERPINEENKSNLEDRLKNGKEPNLHYDQLLYRLRTSYWNLLQMNSQHFQYPAYYNPILGNQCYFDPNLLGYYNMQNMGMDIYQFPYVLQYNPYSLNMGMGIGMGINENMNRNSTAKPEPVIQPQYQTLGVGSQV